MVLIALFDVWVSAEDDLYTIVRMPFVIIVWVLYVVLYGCFLFYCMDAICCIVRMPFVISYGRYYINVINDIV